VTTSDLDLRTAVPFGIACWAHSTFANYIVELRSGDVVGSPQQAVRPVSS
jgi:hypothetical protein